MNHDGNPSLTSDAFARLTDRYASQPGVTTGTGFGSTAGLRIGGRIFAMFMDESLVVKLPADRVQSLIATGQGAPFGSRKGHPMREWVAVGWSSQDDWERVADEALAFVRDGSSQERRAP
jgi:hypothetical protein